MLSVLPFSLAAVCLAASVDRFNFSRNSLDWQVQQLQQQAGEQLERWFTQINFPQTDLPSWQLPIDWFRAIFGLAIALLSLQLGRYLWRWLRPYWVLWRSQAVPARQGLPAPNASEWLVRSRRAAQQGDYREACRSLYMAALQQLHEQNLVRQEASRTDGEYLRLVQPLARMQPYRTLIQTHERLKFSNLPITGDHYDRCWQAYQEIVQP